MGMAYATNTWLWEVYQHTRTAGRESLHSCFRGQTRKNDLTAGIVNMISGAARAVFSADSSNSSTRCNLSHDETQDWTIDRMQCAIYLYYQVAEHLLQQLFPPQQPVLPDTGEAAAKRFKGLVKATHNPECYELVKSHEFHMPLIECALHVVAFVIEGPEQQYPRATELLQRSSCAPTLWWAARSFQECFSSSSRFPMPVEVQYHLQQVQVQLLDQPMMATGSLMYNIIEQGGGGIWKDGDTGLAAQVLRAYSNQAVQRAQLIGWLLQEQQQEQQGQQDMPCLQPSQQLPESFHDQCGWLMDKLLLHHLEVVFSQHMSVVAACVAYVSAKLVQVNIMFKRITEATLMCSSGLSAEVFQRSEIQPAVGAEPAQYGDIRMFYNTRFLPAIVSHVRQYLQDYQDMVQQKAAAAAAAHSEHSKIPSPQPSSAASQTPGGTSRRPLAALTLNALTQGAAGGQLPSKAAARTKGWKTAAVVEECVASDADMQDVENNTPPAPAVSCKAAVCLTPSRLMR